MTAQICHPSPKVQRNGDTTIITLGGGPVRDVENVLGRDLDGLTGEVAAGHLLLDFTNVEFLSSIELGTLIGLHKRLRADGGRLTLFNLSPQVFEVFAITRLESLLGICQEEATIAAP